MIGIYKITSPTGKVYIGQSIDIEKRFYNYRKIRCKNQRILYNSFLKHGVESHVFEIIEECCVEELNTIERYYQDLYSVIGSNGLNGRLVSCKDRSGKLTESHKIKISIANKGRKHTACAKLKIKESKMNISKETRMKMSISQTGKIRSLEHINNIKKSTKGVKKTKNPDKLRMDKIVLDTENGIFYTVNELSKLHNKKAIYFYHKLLGINKNKTNYIYV